MDLNAADDEVQLEQPRATTEYLKKGRTSAKGVLYAAMKRAALSVVAVIVALAGAAFALQGLRVLPSPVMYGEPSWIVIGSAMVLAGIAVLSRIWRRSG